MFLSKHLWPQVYLGPPYEENASPLSHICIFCAISPGGPLECQGGYPARPKIHVIRVVFSGPGTVRAYIVKGCKNVQNWKKGCVFGHTDKFWKGHDGQIKKNACKNAYLGSIFIPEKYVIRVLFVCPWTSLIPPLAIRVAPLGDFYTHIYKKNSNCLKVH